MCALALVPPHPPYIHDNSNNVNNDSFYMLSPKGGKQVEICDKHRTCSGLGKLVYSDDWCPEVCREQIDKIRKFFTEGTVNPKCQFSKIMN